jgi:hypothetical protein
MASEMVTLHPRVHEEEKEEDEDAKIRSVDFTFPRTKFDDDDDGVLGWTNMMKMRSSSMCETSTRLTCSVSKASQL